MRPLASNAPPPSTPQGPRLHALDALRAFALCLGVVLHALLSFIPGDGWPIADSASDKVLFLPFHVIHMFRMTLFFFVAGYFARVAWLAKGTRLFVRDRARRIVLPLVLGWLAIVPLTVGIVYLVSLRTGVPLKRPPPGTFPLMHLWFLYLLTGLYLGLWALGTALEWVDRQGHLRRRLQTLAAALARHPLGVAVLGLPVALALTADPSWVVLAGIPAPDRTLLPVLAPTVAFGVALGVGWLLHAQGEQLADLRRHALRHLAFASVLTLLSLVAMDHYRLVAPGVVLQGWPRLAYAELYAAAGWAWTLGLTGLALRVLSQPDARIRELADASYWIYLMHIPVVVALQAVVMDWPGPWALKLTAIIALTLWLLLLSYRHFVRNGPIGRLLGGQRMRN